MFFFGAFVLVILLFLCFVSAKYRNPYKLIFIFGKKGAGKSCYMVNRMLYYKKRGWNIYTDMADVNIPGVRIFETKDISTYRPVEHSVVFLDEVGISMDNRNYKSFPPGMRDFFKYLRKMKCICYMNSQAYDVDKKVRDTVDGMMLFTSFMGAFTLCRPITRSVTLTEPSADSESRLADFLKFEPFFNWKVYYMPRYFKYFDSLAMPSRDYLPYVEVNSGGEGEGGSTPAIDGGATLATGEV